MQLGTSMHRCGLWLLPPLLRRLRGGVRAPLAAHRLAAAAAISATGGALPAAAGAIRLGVDAIAAAACAVATAAGTKAGAPALGRGVAAGAAARREESLRGATGLRAAASAAAAAARAGAVSAPVAALAAPARRHVHDFKHDVNGISATSGSVQQSHDALNIQKSVPLKKLVHSDTALSMSAVHEVSALRELT